MVGYDSFVSAPKLYPNNKGTTQQHSSKKLRELKAWSFAFWARTMPALATSLHLFPNNPILRTKPYFPNFSSTIPFGFSASSSSYPINRYFSSQITPNLSKQASIDEYTWKWHSFVKLLKFLDITHSFHSQMARFNCSCVILDDFVPFRFDFDVSFLWIHKMGKEIESMKWIDPWLHLCWFFTQQFFFIFRRSTRSNTFRHWWNSLWLRSSPFLRLSWYATRGSLFDSLIFVILIS